MVSVAELLQVAVGERGPAWMPTFSKFPDAKICRSVDVEVATRADSVVGSVRVIQSVLVHL